MFKLISRFFKAIKRLFSSKPKENNKPLEKKENIPNCKIDKTIIRDTTYNDLLEKEEWKNKRSRILERDYYCCRWCGERENLQVHHKYYSKYPNNEKVMPWNYPDDALVTLCRVCHKKAHNKTIKVYYRSWNRNYV